MIPTTSSDRAYQMLVRISSPVSYVFVQTSCRLCYTGNCQVHPFRVRLVYFHLRSMGQETRNFAE